MTDPRRSTPSVNAVLDALGADSELLPRPLTIRVIRSTLEAWKHNPVNEPIDTCREAVRNLHSRRLRPVINATGVLLHTNLGRAPLSAGAAERVSAIARGYSTLEFDPVTGQRGDRQLFTSELIAAALNTDAALVVNNGAAGVLLACSALASGREVVVSRGELVEIGGSFRIPDIVTQSGARLVEVGTTNRTHLSDYLEAVSESTAIILRVHPSNYRISGFTSNVAVAELSAASKVPIVVDAGSGLFGERIADEPEVGDVLAQGASLVIFSADKLFGGPQAGVIAGDARLVATLRKSPLYRALRCGKLTIAALNETLIEKLNGTLNPVAAGLAPDLASLRERGSRIVAAISGVDAEVTEVVGAVGGGSLPGVNRPSVAVTLKPPRPAEVARGLLRHDPPVVARVENDRLVIDLSCVAPDDDEVVVAALRGSLS